MKADALSFSEATRAVLIGISAYRESALKLQRPAADVRALASALRSPDGCGVPDDNIATLLDDDASAENILGAVAKSARICQPHDILLVFFAGHGQRREDRFYLLPVDANSSKVAETGIAAELLEAALTGTRARGVLVVLDCCKGGGYAESAGAFFRTLSSGADFRILLSASRADQPSFEDDKGTFFSKYLTRTIAGQDDLGQGGRVYLTELVEHLQDSVAEELERAGRPEAQEPVFAGSYTRDPLLFVHRRQSLRNVRFNVQKYSRNHLRLLILRSVSAIVALLTFGFGSLYTWLDHRQYIASNGTNLALFRGHPKVPLPGFFPEQTWTFDLPASATSLGRNLRLDQGQALTARAPGPILDELARQLDPEWRAAFDLSRGHKEDLLAALHGANPGRSSSAREGIIATLEALSDYDDLDAKAVDEVSGFIHADNPSDVEAAAYGVLARSAPDGAVEQLEGGGSDADSYSMFFRELTKVTPTANRFLIDTAKMDNKEYLATRVFPQWQEALWRLDVSLDEKTYQAAIQNHLNSDKGLIFYAARRGYENLGQYFLDDLTRAMAAGTRSFDAIDRDLLALTLLDPSAVPDSVFDLLPRERGTPFGVEVTTVNALLARSPTVAPKIVALAPDDPFVAGALVRAGCGAVALPVIQVSARRWAGKDPHPNTEAMGMAYNTEANGMAYMIAEVRRMGLSAALPSVALLVANSDPSVQVEALRCIEAIGVDSSVSAHTTSLRAEYLQAVPRQQVNLEVSFDTLWPQQDAWLVAHSEKLFGGLLDSLIDNGENQAPSFRGQHIVSMLALSDRGVELVRARLDVGAQRAVAAAILAMIDEPKRVVSMLLSADAAIRTSAADFGCFNEKYADIERLLPNVVKIPTSSVTTFRRDVRRRKEIERELAETANNLKALMLLSTDTIGVSGELRPGLTLWKNDLQRRWAAVGPAEWVSVGLEF